MEFSTELVETIDHAARQSGESPEAFVREAVLRRLEDIEDIALATERLRNPGKRIPFDEVVKNLGLDD